jgi:hypothetical protein
MTWRSDLIDWSTWFETGGHARAWKEFVTRILGPDDGYSWPQSEIPPPLHQAVFDAPWGKVLGQLNDSKMPALLEACEELMLSAGPSSRWIRYTILRVLYELAGLSIYPLYYSEELEDDVEDPEIRPVRDDVVTVVKRLVESLPIEGVQPEWSSIRWELQNAAYVRSWERLFGLLSLAEERKLAPSDHIRWLRGQSALQFADDDGESPLWGATEWSFEIAVSGSEPLGRLLLCRGLRLETQSLTEFRRTVLTRAYTELEAATRTPSPYRALAAHARRCVDDHRGASGLYASLIDEGDVPEDLRPSVFRLTFESFNNAKATEDAKATLRTWSVAYPNDFMPRRLEAQLLADEADYRSAYEQLRIAAELNTDLEQDVGVRLALAFGALHAGEGRPASVWLMQNEVVANLIDRVVGTHWPTYLRLSSDSRKQWQYSVYLEWNAQGNDPWVGRRAAESALGFVRVVEVELREAVFSRFRAFVRNDRQTLHWAQSEMGKPDQRPLAEAIVQSRQLTLGEMAWVLGAASRRMPGLTSNLHAWLTKEHASLLRGIERLNELKNLRNPQVHSFKAVADPSRTRSLAQDVLFSIHQK